MSAAAVVTHLHEEGEPETLSKAGPQRSFVMGSVTSMTETRLLARLLLVERLELERALYSGLRMIMLCALLFWSLISTLHYQTNKSAQFALQQSYEDTFNLASAAEIVAPHQLRASLREFSAQVRTLQVLSSEFFEETQGQLKILGGIKEFSEAQVLEVAELMPRVDSAAFTFMAWVQRDSLDSSGYIVRKPLGRGQERSLSCYGWFLGSAPQLHFGAHDVGLPDQSDDEERVEASGEWEKDDAFHLEMVVVNTTTISFYRDAVLRSWLPLRRPVTDCSGGTLLLGDTGLRMAEVTFYARALSQTEIEEVFFAGFTFEAIASGRIPHHPHETDFDRLLGAQDDAVATLLSSQDQALAQAAVGRVLTQALIQELQGAGAAPFRTVTAPADSGCASEWPPCQIIRNVTETVTTDSFTGKRYFSLVPPDAAPTDAGPQDRVVVPAVARADMIQYDAGAFPSWSGQSCSFSVWIKPTVLGYLVAKSPGSEQNVMCWSLYVSESWGMGSVGQATTPDGEWRYPENMMRWGGSLEAADGNEVLQDNGKKLRHLAWVFDIDSNSLRTYIDGALLGDQPFEDADTVGRLDCPVTNATYIGFANRPPGGLPFVGEMQDFRMYVGTALTGEEVRGLSEGEGSVTKRECSLSTEGQDANYKDMNGNNCAWYQEATAESAAVCTASSVRAQCPVACSTQEPCYEPASPPAPSYQIWEKVMRLQPKLDGVGSLCVREGLDAVAECASAMARADPHSYPPDGSAWSDRFLSLSEGGLGEWNLTDCRLMAAMVDPSCSFKVPGEWTRSFDAEAQASGEWTVSFWMKSGKAQLGTGVDTWITLYSSVAPPVPLLRVVNYFGILLLQVWGRPECETWVEDVNLMVSYEAGQWVHLALVFGAPSGPQGQRQIQLVKDAEYMVDLLNRGWCPPASGEFVQAVSVFHAFQTLISPIHVTARAKSVKALQLEYYQLRPAFRWRRGPDLPEPARHSRPVHYQHHQFDAPGALLAPPILLQRRLQSTSECAASAGSRFQDRVWRDATRGMTCSAPYKCSDALLGSTAGLMSCRGTLRSDMFLGRAPLTVRGQEVFAEFLPSIADASILVREGELFQTSTFIDTQTESLVLPVVLFAPNVGVLTLLSIEATFSSRVHVAYSVKQFQAVEGDDLAWAVTQAAVTLVLVGLAVVELVVEGLARWRHGAGREVRYIVADLVVLAVIPVVFLSMRVGQLRESADIMAKATGEDGLGGVPWASTDISVDVKMDRFFAGLEELQGHIDREQRMSVLGFVAASVLLVRVIFATKAHPRTAVLVTTIIAAADDLWHFCLLFLVLFLGFGALAHVSFGMRTTEFHSLDVTFETLFDMMLGSLPRSGAARSQSWTADPLLIIFVALFNFLVFFVMLNFIIAIIVESYLSTKQRLEEELAEQEFITDIIASMRALIKRLMHRWPTHTKLIDTLKEYDEPAVGTEALETLFSSWERASVRRFVAHYSEYDFLCPGHASALGKLEGLDLVNEIDQRVQRALQQRTVNALASNGPASGALYERKLSCGYEPGGSELDEGAVGAPKKAETMSDTCPGQASQVEPLSEPRSQSSGWTTGERPAGAALSGEGVGNAMEPAVRDDAVLPNVVPST